MWSDCSSLCFTTAEELPLLHSPDTVVYKLCYCLKQSIWPLEALKSPMPNPVAVCRVLSFNSVPLIPALTALSLFKPPEQNTLQLLKW